MDKDKLSQLEFITDVEIITCGSEHIDAATELTQMVLQSTFDRYREKMYNFLLEKYVKYEDR